MSEKTCCERHRYIDTNCGDLAKEVMELTDQLAALQAKYTGMIQEVISSHETIKGDKCLCSYCEEAREYLKKEGRE